MKRILLCAIITILYVNFSFAQLLPSFQFGIKGGVNITNFNKTNKANGLLYNNAGYLGGFWARAGAAGIFFQPELYLTSKTISYNDNSYQASTQYAAGAQNNQSKTKLTSIDVPLLIGTKFGVLGSGLRLNTGPLVSFAINNKQTLSNSFQNSIAFRYKDQNYGWQFGLGADIFKLSVDARYEAGISSVENDYGDKKHINLFNFSLGYRLF